MSSWAAKTVLEILLIVATLLGGVAAFGWAFERVRDYRAQHRPSQRTQAELEDSPGVPRWVDNSATQKIYHLARHLESTTWMVKLARFEALSAYGLAAQLEDSEHAMREIWDVAEKVSELGPAAIESFCSEFEIDRSLAEDYAVFVSAIGLFKAWEDIESTVPAAELPATFSRQMAFYRSASIDALRGEVKKIVLVASGNPSKAKGLDVRDPDLDEGYLDLARIIERRHGLGTVSVFFAGAAVARMEGATHCAEALVDLTSETGLEAPTDACENIMRDAENARDSVIDHGAGIVGESKLGLVGSGPAKGLFSMDALADWKSYVFAWDSAIREALSE